MTTRKKRSPIVNGEFQPFQPFPFTDVVLTEEEIKQARLEEQQRKKERAQELADQMTFIMDQVKAHPLLQDLMGLKWGQETPHDKYMKMVLPAVITANPGMAHYDIVNHSAAIVKGMLELEPPAGAVNG